MLHHAAAVYPAECCGLLVGQADEVRTAEPAHNMRANERADRFEIDPVDHVRVWEAATANGNDIIGCYHSHPDGYAVPSAIDRGLARRFGGPFGYIVVAIQDTGDCQLFAGMIEADGQIAPVPVEYT
jgi:desampylase